MVYMPFKKWLGLATNESSPDILPVEFTVLKNFNPFKRPGRLIPDKGYKKRYASDSYNELEFLAYFKENNGENVIVVNDSDSLWLYVDDVKQTSPIYTAKNLDKRTHINNYGVLRISGNIFSHSGYDVPFSDDYPLWLGKVKRKRFYYSTFPGGFFQSIDQYFCYKKGLDPPNIVTTGNEDNYDIGVQITGVGSGGGLPSGSYRYAFAFVYDGFQESAYDETTFYSSGSYDSFSIQINVNQNINRRITGIVVYRAVSGSYYYLKTVSFIKIDTVFTQSGSSYIHTFSDEGDALTELLQNRNNLGLASYSFSAPYYKFGLIFKGRMYVANVHTLRDVYFTGYGYSIEEHPRMWLISESLQYDAIPNKNYSQLPDEITAIGKTNSSVILWTKKDMYFVDELQVKNELQFHGCTAPNSVAYYEDLVFWANNDHIWMWNGLRAVNIETKIRDQWINLDESDKAKAQGTFEPKDKEYYLTIPNKFSYIFNLDSGQWRLRDIPHTRIVLDADENLIGILGSYVYDLNSGYDLDSATMICKAITGMFVLDKRQYIQLMRFYLLHICKTGTMKIIISDENGILRETIVDNQSIAKILDYSLAGIKDEYDSIIKRQIKIQFYLESPSSVDYIEQLGLEGHLLELL